MFLFLSIDRTEEAPVDGAVVFQSKEAMLEHLGFNADGCSIGDEDSPYGFDEDEVQQLLTTGVVYRDKREIFQMIEVELTA